jgi:hypothetical protein
MLTKTSGVRRDRRRSTLGGATSIEAGTALASLDGRPLHAYRDRVGGLALARRLLPMQEVARMNGLRVWIILAWIALPTVMFGGYSLLQLLNQGNALTPFQVTWFRAGHAHAGVLLVMSLLYYTFMDTTAFSPVVKHLACAALFVGILAQSGGFFIHMLVGQPNQASIGNTVTVAGAILLACAILVLVYGLITAP